MELSKKFRITFVGVWKPLLTFFNNPSFYLKNICIYLFIYK